MHNLFVEGRPSLCRYITSRADNVVDIDGIHAFDQCTVTEEKGA